MRHLPIEIEFDGVASLEHTVGMELTLRRGSVTVHHALVLLGLLGVTTEVEITYMLTTTTAAQTPGHRSLCPGVFHLALSVLYCLTDHSWSSKRQHTGMYY